MYNLSIYHIQLFLPPLWLDWHAASARAVAGNFANIPARLSSKKRGFARWMEGSSQPWLTWFWNTAYLLAFCFLQKADLVPSKIFYVWHMLNDLHKECISPATEASRVALWGNLKTAGQIPTSWNHRERCVVPSLFLGFQKLPEVLGKKNHPFSNLQPESYNVRSLGNILSLFLWLEIFLAQLLDLGYQQNSDHSPKPCSWRYPLWSSLRLKDFFFQNPKTFGQTTKTGLLSVQYFLL